MTLHEDAMSNALRGRDDRSLQSLNTCITEDWWDHTGPSWTDRYRLGQGGGEAVWQAVGPKLDHECSGMARRLVVLLPSPEGSRTTVTAR